MEYVNSVATIFRLNLIWLQDIEEQIRAIKSGANEAHKDVAHKTVFSELLNSDLPAEEKAVERLKHEGKNTLFLREREPTTKNCFRRIHRSRRC
jgi:hypothetical protein